MILRRHDGPTTVTISVIASDGRSLMTQYRADLAGLNAGRKLIAADIREMRRALRMPWTTWTRRTP